MKLLSILLFMLCSFLNSSNFSYKMDTHFTVTNNQIEIPGHLNYATYQLEGAGLIITEN